jgi:hypothetical protein
MSKSVANVVIATDSFSTLITRTNQIADALSNEIVTANGSSTGATTTGNAAIVGILSSNTIAVTTSLRGGTVSTPGNLNITSNVVFTNGVATVNSNLIVNNSTTSLYSNNTTFGGNNLAISASNTVVSGQATLAGSVFANGDFYIHNSNTYIDSYSMTVAGSTIELNPTQLYINATSTSISSNTVIDGQLAVANTITISGGILFGPSGIFGQQTFAAIPDLGANTTAPQLVWTYPKAGFTLGNFYTVVRTGDAANVQSTQASIITNGTDAYMTVFAVLAAPNTANLGVFTVGTDAANVNLYYTQTQPNSIVTLNITLNS